MLLPFSKNPPGSLFRFTMRSARVSNYGRTSGALTFLALRLLPVDRVRCSFRIPDSLVLSIGPDPRKPSVHADSRVPIAVYDATLKTLCQPEKPISTGFFLFFLGFAHILPVFGGFTRRKEQKVTACAPCVHRTSSLSGRGLRRQLNSAQP
jgi:hypothetical protein